MAQNIHLVTTVVAIMAILKKNIWILLEHNCCNCGNSEKKDTVDSWWHNCCNCGNCGKKQIWIPVTTIVAFMAILKNSGDINCRNYGNFEEKNIWIPFHHNCRNYGNSEKDTVDSWWQQLLQLWQLSKNKYESWWQQLSQLWQFWKWLKKHPFVKLVDFHLKLEQVLVNTSPRKPN